ncbi:hypothetical protein EV644_13426 [Kribbella orskensis]|uniref:Uncharacterized protein n=1 Tax=Kribbella orskensis TaxID=2512216 RepID=A0ABY2B7J8_9ACTN|nr:hypothetical protein EV642_13625 [Kribbella sp. VKM Ac-2500]TCO10278.1 hypothetical protein EV644_13426 [Kribbella orskensis]
MVPAAIALVAVRRAGIYFAMVTLAFAQMVYYVANQWRGVVLSSLGLPRVTNNSSGLSGRRTKPTELTRSSGDSALR